jgi:hypothetical protein
MFEKNCIYRQSCWLPDSASQGVVFWLRISQNRNGSKCSVWTYAEQIYAKTPENPPHCHVPLNIWKIHQKIMCCYPMIVLLLVTRFFASVHFSWIIFHQAPDFPSSTISDFYWKLAKTFSFSTQGAPPNKVANVKIFRKEGFFITFVHSYCSSLLLHIDRFTKCSV